MDFYVWVVLCSDLAADRLMACLVREGYGVTPASVSGKPTIVGEVSCMAALKLTKSFAEEHREPQKVVMEVLKAIFKAQNLMHHGLIVQPLGGIPTWNSSNITLPTKQEKEAIKTDIERILMPGDEIG